MVVPKNVTVLGSLLIIDMFIPGEILSVTNPQPVKRNKSTEGGTYGATVFGALNQIFKKSVQSVAAEAFFWGLAMLCTSILNNVDCWM